MLEIYDCTLREGEQAGGVSFSVNDRIRIAKALYELKVDFIELGWPIHKEAMEAFNALEKEKLFSKVVAFGSTSIAENVSEDVNLKSIIKSKAKYACIFGKTWIEHVEKQLKITKQENLNKILNSVKFLKENNTEVFYDAEHYFDGFKHDENYSLKTIEVACIGGARRIILCDTNGGTLPEELRNILIKTKNYLKEKNISTPLGVHMHNDSGLALTNSLESLEYTKQIQGTINGIGERVGNLDLCEFIPLLMLKKNLKLSINLEKLRKISDLVYEISNMPKKINQAFISQRAYSHKGGIHIDATVKGASYGHIKPESLGFTYDLILTSLGGAACVVSTAKKFGYNLDKKDARVKKILEELAKIEKKGYDIGNISSEQHRILKKYLGNYETKFKIKEWKIITTAKKSLCTIKLILGKEEISAEEELNGGPIEAIFKALKTGLQTRYPSIENIKLLDYRVRITKVNGIESVVRTRIDFSNTKKFSTVGISENIIESGLEAIQKAFEYELNFL